MTLPLMSLLMFPLSLLFYAIALFPRSASGFRMEQQIIMCRAQITSFFGKTDFFVCGILGVKVSGNSCCRCRVGKKSG